MIKRPAAVLVLLTALNYLNYLDRYVLAAVLPRVQEELHLSNKIAGLLATVFLLGYFVTAPIFGSLADKRSRKGLIIVGIALWSFATIGSGLATTAGLLLLARAMVGVGEASYATIAPTIIDDIAPAAKKGRYLSIFFLATSVGSASGYLVGGAAERAIGWRGAFYVAGIPGLVLVFVTMFMQEPPRGTTASAKVSIPQAARALLASPVYRVAVFGYCAYTGALGAFAFWAPKFLYSRYNMDLLHANSAFGTVTVLGGAAGTVVGGFWADATAKKAAARTTLSEKMLTLPEAEQSAALAKEVERQTSIGYLRVCSISAGIAAPFAALAFIAPTPLLFFIAAGVAEVLLFVSTAPVNAALLRGAPPAFRASAMAVAIFMIHMLGDLWSPFFIGALADIPSLPLWLAMMPLPMGIALASYLWWPKTRVLAAVDGHDGSDGF